MADQRLTQAQKQELSLRELFELEASQKENVRSEVDRFVKDLEGIVDSASGQNVLDMKIKDMDVGQVIGDVIEKSPFGLKDKEKNPDTRTRSQGLVVRLKAMFGGAGFSTDYVDKEIKGYLGADAYEENTKWSLFRARKQSLGFPDDVYPRIKSILQDPNMPLDQKLQMSAHLFGGFRPATLNTFSIENFDPAKGIITVFDEKTKKPKITILNSALVDIFKQASEGRKTGPVFLNVKKNTPIINKVLKATFPEGVAFLKPTGVLERENFTVYKLRSMNETLLSETGLGESDTAFLSGRAPTTEAAGYVSEKSRKRRIDRAGQEVIAKIVGYSGDSSPAQYGADTGINFSSNTNKIAIRADLLEDPAYVDVLPAGFVDSLPTEGDTLTGKAAEADPELVAQRREEALARSGRVTEEELTRQAQAVVERKGLTEEAARIKAEENERLRLARQQQRQQTEAEARDAEIAKTEAKINPNPNNMSAARARKAIMDSIKGAGGKALKGLGIYAVGEALYRSQAAAEEGKVGEAIGFGLEALGAPVPLGEMIAGQQQLQKTQELEQQYGQGRPVFSAEALFGRGKPEESPQPSTQDQMDSLGISPDSSYP